MNMSQSLRESGRFVQDGTGTWTASANVSRNPFVNQVVSFSIRLAAKYIQNNIKSQSLRESGRFVPLQRRIMGGT